MAKLRYLDQFAYKTDLGRVRMSNQDQAHIVRNVKRDILLLIADGVGGAQKGDYASKLAADYLTEEFKKNKGFLTFTLARIWLQYHIAQANKIIYEASLTSPLYKGMGTTLVVVLIHHDKLLVANAGDSRAYLLGQDQLTCISEDQSLVDYLARSGQIKDEEKAERKDKNIIYNALGIYPAPSYFMSRAYHFTSGMLLLCSDGLYNNVTLDEMQTIMRSMLTPEEKVKKLIRQANLRGGTDNIGVAYLMRTVA
ncbi:MAG: protein phosphatase 2C domain-containing protein [Bacilli bacterium]|nr:protein phosphatase 2C domain-containing protein [Bacilli bacterium]